VPNKAPLIALLSPGRDSVHAPGQPILFQAMATDFEDGSLAAASLTWSSDRDGPGCGRLYRGGQPLARWHTITASTRDSAGAVGQTSVRVMIGERLWLPWCCAKWFLAN